MPKITLNNHDYSDDGTADRDMEGEDGYGYATWLLPMLGDAMLELGAASTSTSDAVEQAQQIKTDTQAAATAGAAAMQAIANSVSTAQADITTKHNTVVTLAGQVQTAKTAVDTTKGQIDAALAGIAGGPVTSVEGYAGVVANKLAKIDLSNVTSATLLPRLALVSGTASFAAGTLTLDLSTGTEFAHTATANITSIVLANAPATGSSLALLRLTNGGAYVVAMPANAVAAGGLTIGIGTLTTAGTDELLFRRNAAGSRVAVSIKKDAKA